MYTAVSSNKQYKYLKKYKYNTNVHASTFIKNKNNKKM